MNVLLIHQAFASPNEGGGTRHYELAHHCIGKGHNFTIVASNLSYLSGKRTTKILSLCIEEILDGIRVLRAYTYPALHRTFIWRVISFFSYMFTSLLASTRSKDIDLVMGTSPPIFQAVSAWVVSTLRRRPFLLEIRDLWPEFAVDMGVLKNPILIHSSRWLEGFLYARADHLLVNSPAYRDYLIGKGVPPAKVSLIPNGVDPAMFDPNSNGKHIRKELGLTDKFIVTYAGALGLANDIPTLLRAANRLRENDQVRFLLVGDGKERSQLEALTKRLDLPNVIFAGSRPKSEMSEILAASDACIAILQDIRMFCTTYPNKVFDYMAAGKPTILAIDGVIREVLQAAKGGIFVSPGDDIALAEAVAYLADNRKQAKAMGIAARNYVVEHFNRYDQAQAFVDLINRLGKVSAKA